MASTTKASTTKRKRTAGYDAADIQAELKKTPDAAARAVEEAVRGALREQARKKGIEVPR